MEQPKSVDQTARARTDLSGKELLRERARRLARPPEDKGKASVGWEALEFRIGTERYAMPVGCLKEVQPARSLTPLPATPGFILGVIGVCGQVVSVMDLPLLLGLPPMEVPEDGRAILLGRERVFTGILADEVLGLTVVREEDLQAGEAMGRRLDPRFASGVTSDRVILLAGANLLSDPALIVSQ